MTTDTMAAVYEDFNDPVEAPAAAALEDLAEPIGDIGEIRAQAWTDGYMTAREIDNQPAGDQHLTAKLLTSLYDLGTTTSAAVDAASLAIADMLVNSVIAATSDDWSVRLLDRVRSVAERIKPALAVAPEFVLRDQHGTEQHFADITELTRAIETAGGGEAVTIRWQNGEATISRTALLEQLQDAIIPLSAGLANEQSARQHR